jgi:hypothetical protein
VYSQEYMEKHEATRAETAAVTGRTRSVLTGEHGKKCSDKSGIINGNRVHKQVCISRTVNAPNMGNLHPKNKYEVAPTGDLLKNTLKNRRKDGSTRARKP